MKLLFTIQETSKALGISRARLYELLASGDVKACKLGHRTMVRAEELKRFSDSLPELGDAGKPVDAKR
jgi:excisionase family DNA binding protein